MVEIPGCDKDPEQLVIAGSLSAGSKCWILIQQNDGMDDSFFDRDWHDYSHGFGDAAGNFWLGNHHLHQLTQILNSGW